MPVRRVKETDLHGHPSTGETTRFHEAGGRRSVGAAGTRTAFQRRTDCPRRVKRLGPGRDRHAQPAPTERRPPRVPCLRGQFHSRVLNSDFRTHSTFGIRHSSFQPRRAGFALHSSTFAPPALPGQAPFVIRNSSFVIPAPQGLASPFARSPIRVRSAGKRSPESHLGEISEMLRSLLLPPHSHDPRQRIRTRPEIRDAAPV